MVSSETMQTNAKTIEPNSSPRISFSSDFLDNTFISSIKISPVEKENANKREKTFEFLSTDSQTMLSADELFSEGKLLPYRPMHHEIKKITLKSNDGPKAKPEVEDSNKESRGSWFVDDDPSPRPPTCTVLWKELLRLKKPRPSKLSPSSSSSSSSSSGSLVDSQGTDKEERSGSKEKNVKKTKKGLERTRSATMRIRPMINVPICTQRSNSALPPLFSFKKGKPEKLK
ncbi:uncharacterized protein LOC141684395 [Apium graveolens]|uniref:uncharacterized protein LOC141684395 n=1 Tax=Apium graveolens TaxID=4045 RepID=UPI003D7B7F59